MKRNVRLTDNLLKMLQNYADEKATNEELYKYQDKENFDIGDFEEDTMELATWVADALVLLCNVKGKVNKNITKEFEEYYGG